jgi:hypothetical protein
MSLHAAQISKFYYFSFCKATTWYRARDWCTERGMQLASLKTASQVEAVSQELKKRGLSKKNQKY